MAIREYCAPKIVSDQEGYQEFRTREFRTRVKKDSQQSCFTVLKN